MPNETLRAHAQAMPIDHRDSDVDFASFGKLLREIETARASHGSETPEGIDDALYEHSWRLREKMDSEPAASLVDLVFKISAAEIALAGDPEAENRGLGSFFSLAQSIFRDVRALVGAPTGEED